MKSRILIIDDVQDTADSLAYFMNVAGFKTIAVYSENDAFKQLQQNNFDVVVTDMWMEQQDSGLNILKEIKNHNQDSDVILITAYPHIQTALKAVNELGAFDFIQKMTENVQNLDFYEQVIATVRRAIDKRTIISGTYHALLIAIQNYKDDSITNLEFPIRDAASIIASAPCG